MKKKWELPIPINTPGSKVVYRFSTSPGDIAFGINYKKSDGKEVNLKPIARVPSHIGSATGTIHPPKEDGVVFFVFDNSYSWLQSKQLTYNVELRLVSNLMLLTSIIQPKHLAYIG